MSEDQASRPQIRFEGVKVSDTRIELAYQVSGSGEADHGQEVWFEVSKPCPFTDDLIAVAMSTLCGDAYSAVHLDLALSDATIAGLADFTRAKVTTSDTRKSPNCAPDRGLRRLFGRRESGPPPRQPREGITLSFSGGFDSLAALALMPEGTNLVSTDWGGMRSRERPFFSRFDPIIVETNVHETPLVRNTWTYMGLGAVLTAALAGSKYHAFGTIFEAWSGNMVPNPPVTAGHTHPPYPVAGFTNAPYVSGLTEVGTLFVVAQRWPTMVGDSLVSLANPQDEKRYRKQVLAQVVADRLGLSFDMNLVEPPALPRFAFGENFVTDFLCLYVIKHGGRALASTFVRDLPMEAIAVAEKLDLTFYERANSTMYRDFPAPLVGGLTERLAQFGIGAFTERDWLDLGQVRQLLGRNHVDIL
jgi:cyanophycin synthetase